MPVILTTTSDTMLPPMNLVEALCLVTSFFTGIITVQQSMLFNNLVISQPRFGIVLDNKRANVHVQRIYIDG